MIYWELVLNPRWVQDLNRDNIPKQHAWYTLPNPLVLWSFSR
jgi:hypothetical protein